MVKIIELLDDLYLNQKIEGKKLHYIQLCLTRLNRWKDFMKQEYDIEDIEGVRAIHIKSYIQMCQSTGKEINSTINGHIATLRVFFKYLVEEEYMEELDNPIRRIKNLKEDKRVIVTFNDDEVARVINDVKEETYSNIRDKLILILLFDTGIRVSELCNIKVNDISRKHILIHGKGSKERLVYISNIMRRYMRKYEKVKEERFCRKELSEIEDYYFLDQCAIQLSRSRINKILKEHCKNVGIRKEVRCSPHDCRHYFAQKQLRNGIDIYSLSRLMGHFDTQITSKYLRGLEQDDILDIGRVHSPLKDLKV